MSVREANDPSAWDKIWSNPEATDWRGTVLAPVYKRIAELMPTRSNVMDVGGGVGMLAEKLQSDGHTVRVVEHSPAALAACERKGIPTCPINIETGDALRFDAGSIVVSTEVLEHLSEPTLHALMLGAAATGAPCFFSVPNDRLGPDEEPQHARKWNAVEFKRFLSSYFADVRVEVLGQPAMPGRFKDRGQPAFLLGICGRPKAVKLSVCFPARDEAADIEQCLASYRGVADELIIGIDPRTTDNTRELAEKYADVVFDLTELQGPPDDLTPPGGFHFAHARNQCMARCTSPWIFMTEAHEPLVDGQDVLLCLDQVPEAAQVVHVVRQGGRAPHREQWLFPWLCRNRPDIRYARSTHNTLVYPDDAMAVTLPQVKTLHVRVHEKTLARRDQRAVQNRLKLMEDWVSTRNSWSLQYLGSEWREHDPEKAVQYLREYLAVGKLGTFRYNTRLLLARTLADLGRFDEVREVLHGASADDWSRTEHWLYLGDLAYEQDKLEEALTYYEYAATKYGRAPLMTIWVDLAMYGWVPAERLTQTYAALGMLDEALVWARRVAEEIESFGNEVPAALGDEAKDIVRQLEEAIHGRDERLRAA